MIEHVYRRAARARSVDAVVVATDDERIAKAVERFGGIVRMTSPLHRTGTDRIAEIARELSCEVVVNVQGDLPLVEPDMIAQVVEPLLTDPTARMSTVYRRVTTMAEYMSPHVVKVVVDRTGHALYFSRAAIPAGPTALVNAHSTTNVFKHIGMYGYRRDFLLTSRLNRSNSFGPSSTASVFAPSKPTSHRSKSTRRRIWRVSASWLRNTQAPLR